MPIIITRTRVNFCIIQVKSWPLSLKSQNWVFPPFWSPPWLIAPNLCIWMCCYFSFKDQCCNFLSLFNAIWTQVLTWIYWTGKSMDHLLSYCKLVNARKSASEKKITCNRVKIVIFQDKITIIDCCLIKIGLVHFLCLKILVSCYLRWLTHGKRKCPV